MNIEKLKEFAATIKHCGDYGELWVNEETRDVVWVAGDADFDEDEEKAGICTSYEDVIKGFLIEGVDSVNIEAESGPDESNGYTNLGKFGIDNWEEVSQFYKLKLNY